MLVEAVWLFVEYEDEAVGLLVEDEILLWEEDEDVVSEAGAFSGRL